MTPRNTVLLGDVVERLRELPDNSVDAIVTDPPYALGFMGKDWDSPSTMLGQGNSIGNYKKRKGDDGYVSGNAAWYGHGEPHLFAEWCWQWGAEALRVLKPGGYVLAFGGTRTYHRLVSGLEDAGFEIRDTIAWLYGSGFPKSKNIGNGFGTALKPAHEPIVVARKPLTGTVAANVLEWGTGALNIDGCRIPADWGNDPTRRGWQGGNSVTIGPTGNFGMTGNRVAQPNELGRWPANVTLDEYAAAMLDEQSGDRGAAAPASGPTYSGPSTRNAMAGGFFGTDTPPAFYGDKGGASRFFYCPKASRADREAGLVGLPERVVNITEGHGRGPINTSKASDGGVRTNHPRQNDHPTVKPHELMRWLCRLVGGQPGSLILDPFAGSGSTLRAAVAEGFDFLGIERDRHYYRLACLRAGLPDPGEEAA